MTSKFYSELEECLIEINKEVEILKYPKVVNLKEEKQKFLKEFPNRYEPIFKHDVYQGKRINLEKLIKQLEKIKNYTNELDKVEKYLLKNKANELILVCRLIDNIEKNPKIFSEMSKKLWRLPELSTLIKALKILKKEYQINRGEKIELENAAKIFQNWANKIGYKVIIDEKRKAFLISHSEKACFLPGLEKEISKERLKRWFHHEIEAHAYRALNGASQDYKIFRIGLANYEKTEEGLALFLEYKNGLFNTERLIQSTLTTIAVFLANNFSFYQTSLIIKKLNKNLPLDLIFDRVARVKRGIKETANKGVYSKDGIYFEGFLEVKKFCKNKENLKSLYYGKISLKDLWLIKELKLREPIYLPKPILPDY